MCRLIIAARIVAFEDQGPEAIRELDQASEAFASDVPWDDEPDATLPIPQGSTASGEGDVERVAKIIRDYMPLRQEPFGGSLDTADLAAEAILASLPTRTPDGDLLEALEGLLAEFEKFSRYGSPIARSANQAFHRARTAISKAHGHHGEGK